MERQKETRPQAYNRHLDQPELEARLMQLQKGAPDASCLDALSHIGQCNYCAEHLAELVEADGLLHAPVDLKASVLREAASPRNQTELALHKTSAKMQFLFYSFRVGGAVLGALVILFLSSMSLSMQGTQPMDSPQEKPWQLEERFSLSEKLRESSSYINGLLQDFSDKLIYMEDFHNDK